MIPTSAERMARLVAQLESNPGLAGQLPGEEAAIVDAALGGDSVHVIAQQRGISTEAVWRVLGNAARAASGQGPAQQVETGGFGSDTDPGVTGGYGETGFGGLEVEPPADLPAEQAEEEALSPDWEAEREGRGASEARGEG